MSKLIESLRASAQEFTKKRSGDSTMSNSQRTQYELTQEQLADIYFSGGDKSTKSDPPMIIKVIERTKPSSSVGPWVISLVAIIITAFSLFSSKRVFVDIKVIDDRNLYSSGWSSSKATPQPNASKIVLRQISTQDFSFEGAATLKSSRSKDILTLSNSSVASFARASFTFDPPLNLTTSKISFSLKGAQGGENLAVSIKDKGNMAAFPKGKYYPYPTGLTNDWQKVEISAQDFLSEFDSRNISNLRFEFGAKEVGNKAGDTILIKDIQVESL